MEVMVLTAVASYCFSRTIIGVLLPSFCRICLDYSKTRQHFVSLRIQPPSSARRLQRLSRAMEGGCIRKLTFCLLSIVTPCNRLAHSKLHGL